MQVYWNMQQLDILQREQEVIITIHLRKSHQQLYAIMNLMKPHHQFELILLKMSQKHDAQYEELTCRQQYVHFFVQILVIFSLFLQYHLSLSKTAKNNDSFTIIFL